MRGDTVFAWATTSCILFAAGMPLPAKSADIRNLFRKAEDGKVVRCESKALESKRCKADVSGGVALIRQLSKTRCVENENWRVVTDGVQVDNGCRADFSIGAVRKVYASEVIVCESVGHRWSLCKADINGDVQLVRQLSDQSVCVRNQTWGVRKEGIWVASGCRAEFRIGAADIPEIPGVPARFTRCDSENGMRKRCRIETGKGVRLAQRISSSPCTYGSTWGYDDDEIWVRRGCRAEFQIDVDAGDLVPAPRIPDDARLVRCESVENRSKRCAAAPVEHAAVKEQLSNKKCEEGTSWRVDRGAIVVKSGCRAVFAVW